jgi:hypothetical protein
MFPFELETEVFKKCHEITELFAEISRILNKNY